MSSTVGFIRNACAACLLVLAVSTTAFAQAGKAPLAPAVPRAFTAPWQKVFADTELSIGVDTSRVERVDGSTYRVWLQTRWATPRSGSRKETPSPFNRELIRTYLRCGSTAYKVVSTVVSLNDAPAIDSVVVNDRAAWAGTWNVAKPQSADAGAGEGACAILRARGRVQHR
ncbi:MAG TPA: hypothetical protein VM076_25175 [Gemmatimonadaceae bacterium]|nr:hypothetical protein [Gemmatimonadaceae bacterium]